MAGNEPIWLFPPSWGDGPLVETFTWMTTVLTDQLSGAEQRQGSRMTPRRMIEAPFVVLSAERTQLDLMLQANGAGRWRVPMWHYANLVFNLEAGDFSIDMDFRGRDVVAGTQILLLGPTARDFEVVTVGSLNANGYALLTANVTRSWPAVTAVPLRYGFLTDQPQVQRQNAFAATVQARFQLSGSNPYTVSAPPTMLYKGLPVLLGRDADQTAGTQGTFQRFQYTLDGHTGGVYSVDTAGFATIMQAHQLDVQGPYAYNRIRDLLYTLAGQLNAVWLPTFADDFKLVEPVAAGATSFVVENVGYTTYAASNPSRKDIFLELNNGTRLCAGIAGSAINSGGLTETILLDTPMPEAFDPYEVYALNFLARARSSSDAIEVTSESGIDGISSCALRFQTEPGLRAVT